MKVPFGSPNINTDAIKTEVIDILSSGWVSIGKYVEELEGYFKESTGVKHAIGTNCATTGLIIAIKAAGWHKERVHLPSFTWPSTLYAVKCSKLQPVFHDIDPDTWLMNCVVGDHEHYINDCVIPVDVFGNGAQVPEGFEKDRIIIDAAHGFGLKNLGHRGIAEVVSLSFTKVVTGMEGGMVLTNDDELAETATELRRLSSRMGEINALVAIDSIRGYAPSVAQFAINHYKKNITVPYKCQEVVTDTNNSVFSMRFENTVIRDAIRIALEKEGIETKVYYDPLQRGLPETEKLYNTILSLPCNGDAYAVQENIIEIINTAGRSARTPGMRFLTT